MEVSTHEPTGHLPETDGKKTLVGPGVPQLPLDRFGKLYPTVSGTGPGLQM